MKFHTLDSLTLSNINQASSLFKDAKISDLKMQKEILIDLKNLTKKQSEDKVLKLKAEFGVEEKPKKNIIKNINQESARVHVNLSRTTLLKLEKVKGIIKDQDLDQFQRQRKLQFTVLLKVNAKTVIQSTVWSVTIFSHTRNMELMPLKISDFYANSVINGLR